MSVTYSGATLSYGYGCALYTFTSGTGSITFPSNTSAQVLIVGGGGGGGGTANNTEGGGGGGGGGVGVGILTFSSGVSYSIVIGAGGSGGVGSAGNVSTLSIAGANSSITGTGISETAYGGGYGANSPSVGQTGGNGGSGGGGNGYKNISGGNPGTSTNGAGTLTYYGNSGGIGTNNYAGGGGGGATSVGEDGIQNFGGNGGYGYTWSVNGVSYGGGGGGGMNGTKLNTAGTGTPGSGSPGGGGTGGSSSIAAVSGTTNLGGGGGGAYGGSGSGGTGGAGGTGVVIIAVQIQNPSPTQSQIPYPWGAYIAGNNTSTTLYDITGNGRHATISGTGLTIGTGSGNGASANIPYISGTTATKITWPSGSVPSTFTICSISRVTAAAQGRVFDGSGSGANWLHGHHSSKSGVAYYNSWVTQNTSNASSVTNYTDWLVMCGTNGSNATPSNILANGVGVGTSNTGTGNVILTINNGTGANVGEASAFSFQQVIIWNSALTNSQLAAVSSALTNYLSTGRMLYPWSPSIYNINNYGLLLHYPFDSSLADYSTGVLATNPTTISNTSIVTTQTMLNSGSAYFTGTTSYLQTPNQTFTTANGGLSLAFWANTTNHTPSAGTTFRFVDFGLGATNNNVVLGIQPVDASGYNLYFAVFSGTTPKIGSTTVPFTVLANVWNHYCMTLTSDGICTIYVNGNVVYTTTVQGAYPTSSANTSCLIGKSNLAADPYFNGYMNSFVAFNRVLTAQEITFLAYYPRYVTITNNMTVTQVFSPAINSANLVHYYPFANDTYNYASGTGVNDALGIVSATLATNTSATESGSLYFSSTAGQMFQAPITALTKNGVTFSAWVKCTNINQPTWSRIFDYGDSSGVHNLIIYVSGSTVGLASNINGTSVINSVTVYTLIDTSWHHYCFTIDVSGNYSFYVDGTRTAVGTAANSIPFSVMNKCYIGKSNYASDGNISAFFNSAVVFNRVLTSSEISYLAIYPHTLYFDTNIITNGNFDATTVPLNAYITVSASYSNTSGATFTLIPSWYFVTYSGNFNIYLANGSGSTPLPSTVNSNSSYCLALQSSTTSVVNGWIYQIIDIPISQLGDWQITFDALSTSTNASPILTVNVVNVSSSAMLLTYSPTVSSSSWNTYSCNFPTTTAGSYRIMFVFNSAGVSLSSITTLFLTNISIQPLLTLQNFVTNGNFDQFSVGGVTNLTDGANTSIASGGTTSSTPFYGLTGWTFDSSGTTNGGNAIIGAGNHAYLQSGLITNPQQHSLVIQQNIGGAGILNMTQQVYLTPGQYQLQYYVAVRSSPYYNTSQSLTVKILNGILTYPVTLTTGATSFTKMQNNFTIINKGNYTLLFSFVQTANNDSSIILTGVQITQGYGYFLSSGASITNNCAQLVPKLGNTNICTFLPNNLVSNYFYNSTLNPFLQNVLYMHSARSTVTGFKINGTDVGAYLQQLNVFDGSYGYSYALPIALDASFSTATAIWAENTTAGLALSSNAASYWFYYTFLHTGSSTTGTIYVSVDDVAIVYINNVFVAYVPITSKSSYSVTGLVAGELNYIRVGAVNTGNYTPGNVNWLGVALFDSTNTLIATTNSNWAWSRPSSTYATTALWSDYDGSLPFYNYGSLTRYTIPSAYYGSNYSVSTSGSYTVFIFTSDGFVNFKNSNASMTLNIFAVGGGGGGGASNDNRSFNGGGGGGEFLIFTHTSINTIKFAAYIGAGGSGGSFSVGGTGGNTRVTTSTGLNVTCIGGGGGGNQYLTNAAVAGTSGGSGGGAAYGASTGPASTKNNGTISGGTVVADLGNSGAGGSFSNGFTFYYTNNGGGGAAAAGSTGTPSYTSAGNYTSNAGFNGGAGGAGANPTSYSSTVGFPSYYFAAGGGGSGFTYNGSLSGYYGGAGGIGGGGGGGFWAGGGSGPGGSGGGSGYLSGSGSAGSNTGNSPGGNALANSGSGGGGGFLNGGSGGSGIVIITVLTSQLV